MENLMFTEANTHRHPFYEYVLWTLFQYCDLDPMTFIYEPYPYCVEIYQMCGPIMNFVRKGFRKLSSDRPIDRQNRPKL